MRKHVESKQMFLKKRLNPGFRFICFHQLKMPGLDATEGGAAFSLPAE